MKVEHQKSTEVCPRWRSKSEELKTTAVSPLAEAFMTPWTCKQAHHEREAT